MKTIISRRISTNLDDLAFGFWDSKAEEFVEISDSVGAATILETSPLLVDALVMLVENIKDSLKLDLVDIWNRLDELEKKSQQGE